MLKYTYICSKKKILGGCKVHQIPKKSSEATNQKRGKNTKHFRKEKNA